MAKGVGVVPLISFLGVFSATVYVYSLMMQEKIDREDYRRRRVIIALCCLNSSL